MKLFSVLFLIFSFLATISFGQSSDAFEIDKAKQRLEELYKKLIQIDLEDESKLKILRSQSEIKGEFETTKQFEERTSKIDDEYTKVDSELRNQSGERRLLVFREINKILNLEFVKTLSASLGVYNADKQTFPLVFDNKSNELLSVPIAEAPKLKQMFLETKVVANIGLTLNERNQAKEYINYATIEFNGRIYKTISENFSVDKAMEKFFGNYNLETKQSVWIDIPERIKERIEWLKSDKKIEPTKAIFTPLGITTFRSNNLDKIILSVAEINEDNNCSACSSFYGFAIFAKKDNYWKLETAAKTAYDSRQFLDLIYTDEFPKDVPSEYQPKLVTIGINKYALVFSENSRADLYDIYLEIKEGYLEEILMVDKGGEGDEIEVNVKFIPKTGKTYFDARVTTTREKYVKVGKRSVLKPYVKVENYVYTNGKYQLIKK